ncbi:MAG: DNA alkylation repair protein [Polyangiales bacterium]
MKARDVKAALRELRNEEKARFFPRFFKTGKGEYGYGDRFMGVVVPDQRKVAKRFKELPGPELVKLLDDPIHECRLTALFIMVNQFERGDAARRRQIFDLYLAHIDRVNNWDLVDASAHKIVGPALFDGDRSLLYELADSGDLWKQRIAIIATLHMIKQDDFKDIVKLATQLRDHDHDLIHKAVGWMLREMGKRDPKRLEKFLDKHYKKMPRTMLRYAIERLPDARRKAYLA